MTSSSTPTPDPARDTPERADDVAWFGSATEAHRPRDTARHAWRAYFEATQMLTDRLERSLKADCGMTLSDYNVLLLLVESEEGSLRLGELASRMVFSPSRVTYQITSLADRGLVERRRVECDRRGWCAVITDQGRSAFRRAAVHQTREIDALFLDHLDPEETETLARVFSRLGRRLETGR